MTETVSHDDHAAVRSEVVRVLAAWVCDELDEGQAAKLSRSLRETMSVWNTDPQRVVAPWVYEAVGGFATALEIYSAAVGR